MTNKWVPEIKAKWNYFEHNLYKAKKESSLCYYVYKPVNTSATQTLCRPFYSCFIIIDVLLTWSRTMIFQQENIAALTYKFQFIALRF